MTLSESTVRKFLEDNISSLHWSEEGWEDGEAPLDGIPTLNYATARDYEGMAHSAALLGATRQSREWYGKAARFYLERIRAGRQLRDICESATWESEIQMFSRAIEAALLSRTEELLTEVATEALEMDEYYLDVFVSEDREYMADYYSVKVKAALALDDERSPQLFEKYKEGVDLLKNEDPYWDHLLEYYQALLNESEAAVGAAITDRIDYYTEEFPNPADPDDYVHSHLCFNILLARRRGLDVDISLESDRLPETLLSEEIPDDVELDVNLEDVEIGSDVGLFELERDENGTPVIGGRIYHPGDEPVSADDVPELEAGQVLSDEWVEAALEEATWRDHYDDDLVAAAKAAFEEGTLVRKLVVVQDRVDQYTFDESLSTLPVDAVDQLKGAGQY